jgi:DNA ligase-1
VIGHEASKSNPGKCGALTLRTPDGRSFSAGSGMTDKDRNSPPSIGAVVTYRYTELSDASVPR